MLVSSGTVLALGRAGPSPLEMELLRAALLPEPRAADAWRRWSSQTDLDEVHHYSHGLLPAVATNLPEAVLGADRERMIGLRRQTWARSQLQLRALSQVVNDLEPLRTVPFAVKGAAMLLRSNPAGTRSLGDIDIVVDPNEFDESVRLLMRRGWEPKAPAQPPSHATNLVHPTWGEVDVHRWALFPRFTSTPESDWYRRVDQNAPEYPPVALIAPAHELVLSIAHALLNPGPSTVRWPLDAHQLIPGRPPAEGVGLFWNQVIDTCRRHELCSVVHAALVVGHDELDLNVPRWVVDELSSATRRDRLAWASARLGTRRPHKFRSYARIERAQGRRPSIVTYGRWRFERLARRGIGPVLRQRVATAHRSLDLARRS